MNLDEIRGKIDNIDDELLNLFSRRMEASLEVARYKEENNLPIFNKSREREIIERITDKSGEDLAMYTKILFSTLFDLSRSYQNSHIKQETELTKHIERAMKGTPTLFPQKAVVACQGVEGAYSQQACDALFPLPSIMYFNNFEGVFHAVSRGLCRYGMLPIENSSYGSVTEVYDLMKKYSFFIVRSIRMKIDHSLLVKPGTKLSDIKEIFSHEQAIGQCSDLLASMKNVKVTICQNTAAASKMVAETDRTDVAAISSRSCASLYGLVALQDNIQNSDNNYTRFICISKDMEIYPGASKISLMVALEHTPGSLYSTIAKFAALGLNLTKLESRPMPGTSFEFMFYFDIDASVWSPEVLKLISSLEYSTDQFVFLGSYSEV